MCKLIQVGGENKYAEKASIWKCSKRPQLVCTSLDKTEYKAGNTAKGWFIWGNISDNKISLPQTQSYTKIWI